MSQKMQQAHFCLPIENLYLEKNDSKDKMPLTSFRKDFSTSPRQPC